ncbi:MAG TPA: 5'-nucleotidase [Yeosuana sp.]
MNYNQFIFLLLVLSATSCKEQNKHLYRIEGRQITINDSLQTNSEIDAFIKPYRTHITKDLDSVLAYAVNTYSKTEGDLNTAIGNFMADAVYEQANPVFKSRTGNDIDMVILNHGGIRSIISKGNITTRTAFELMPFENSLVVVALKGSQIDSLINFLVENKTAHPISQLKISVDKNFNAVSATIKGNKLDTNITYYVATNDYLYNGGNNMTFFKPNEGFFNLDYKIRNVLIDYFKKVDTLNPVIDDRFVQIK